MEFDLLSVKNICPQRPSYQWDRLSILYQHFDNNKAFKFCEVTYTKVNGFRRVSKVGKADCGFFPPFLDVDECEAESHQCNPTQVCINTAGGYTCSCTEGYWLVGGQCQGKIYRHYEWLV